MSHFFIADLHLNSNSVRRNEAFITFLSYIATQAEALYILGDLFDFWIGDDDSSPFHLSIIQALRRLTEQGVKCYLTHGNRDFMVGYRFAQQSGVHLLPACSVLTLAQQRYLILHGDLLCTDDKKYQFFRRVVHCKLLQGLFLLLPLRWRRYVASKIRGNSERANQIKADYLLNVNPYELRRYATLYQADCVIHGHTHRPIQQWLANLNIEQFEHIVLGSWEELGWVLKIDDMGQRVLYDFEL